MVSRRVPVHRAARSVGGGAPRSVSRPGTSSDGKSNFQSPYQPPPAQLDLAGDLAALRPDDWQMVHAAEMFWRVHVPGPAELSALTAIPEMKGGDQVKAMNAFIARHMHPEDLGVMLEKMTDPQDPFDSHDYQAVYRAVVTAGTARPFWQSSASRVPPSTVGALFEPSYTSVVFRNRRCGR